MNKEQGSRMKVKWLLAVNIILSGVIIYGWIHMKEFAAEQSRNRVVSEYYDCLINPIDSLFAEALYESKNNAEYRVIQKLYYETWKTQYDDIMKIIRDKCIYEEDIANYELFTKEMEEGFDKLQPLILTEMLDNYNIPRQGWGNGTGDRLRMYYGTMYRNACMFFIPILEESEYVFPVNEIEQSLSEIE